MFLMDRIDNLDVFISYIVPCFNVGKHLPRCLESLAKQKIKEGARIEYILVNDGSKDDTLSILNEFAANDNRAIVIDQDNKGVCAARNSGLKLAKGKYVYFHDGDDILTDEASQLVFDESKKKESDIIIPQAYKVKEEDIESTQEWTTFRGLTPGIYPTQAFVSQIDCLPISVKVYKREVLVNNNILFDEDLKVGEVYTFFIHALLHSKYVTLTDGHMMKWVVRSGGTTIGYCVDRDRKILKTIHRIDQYVANNSLDLKKQFSYHMSLYRIANIFSMKKYPNISEYTVVIGKFLTDVKNDMVYNSTLRFFLFNKPHFRRTYLNMVLLYFFPVKVYYLMMRLRIMKRISFCKWKCGFIH
jgi:glycosyltransferase involved in cell wall biosynthesis